MIYVLYLLFLSLLLLELEMVNAAAFLENESRGAVMLHHFTFVDMCVCVYGVTANK